MPAEVALIAAMRRELWPLIKTWNRLASDGFIEMYVHGEVFAICGGIGAAAARRAAETAIRMCEPRLLVSVGFAGALDPNYKVGATIVPATVINMSTGQKFDTSWGRGVLVSSSDVIGLFDKRAARQQFGATAVDMEAASVAQVAREQGIAFMAMKAISDDAEFSMPSFDRFVDEQGRFHAASFMATHLLLPRSWPAIAHLAINCRRASQNLCQLLAHHIEQQSFQQHGAGPLEAISPKRN